MMSEGIFPLSRERSTGSVCLSSEAQSDSNAPHFFLQHTELFVGIKALIRVLKLPCGLRENGVDNTDSFCVKYLLPCCQ